MVDPRHAKRKAAKRKAAKRASRGFSIMRELDNMF